MPTINRLPLLGTPSSGDQIPVYAPNSGDARRMSINSLADYIEDNLSLPDNAANITYNPAGTGAVATTVQTKLRETVSVKDFGAVGDGVTDDTAAIQAAIDSHRGKIFLPTGTYKISSTIIIRNETILIGEGGGAYFQGSGYPRLTAFKPIASFPNTDIFRADPADDGAGGVYRYGVALRDLLIDCINIKNESKTILSLLSLSNSETFDSVRIVNNNSNLALKIGISSNVSALESDGLVFSNLYTLQCDSGGSSANPVLMVESANEIVFRDSKFQRGSDPATASGSKSVYISAASGRAVNAVTFDNCSFAGAEVGLRVQGNSTDGQGPRWIRTRNCTFEGPKYPIYVSGTSLRPAQFNSFGPGDRFIALAAGGTGIVLDVYASNNQVFVDEFATVLLNTNSSANTIYGGGTVTDSGSNNARIFRTNNKIDANGFYIESWISATPGSGWSNGSPSNRTSLSYRKDSFGNVYLQGYLSGGSWGFPNYIMTLPVGYRPPTAKTQELPANGDTGTAVKIVVLDTGQIFGVGSGTGLILDGIRFSLS